jgi:DNA-binding GntR family transcriptional regulator
VRDRWVPLRIVPISLGELRKVAEQREMLESGWVSQAAANYAPEKRLSQLESGRSKVAEVKRNCLEAKDKAFANSRNGC